MLHIFVNYTLAQVVSTVRVTRSFDALDFDSRPCKEHFAAKSIIHQTAYVYRQHLNRVVKR